VRQIVWVTALAFLVFGCSGINDFSRETYRIGHLTDSFRNGEIGLLLLSGGEKTDRYIETARDIFHNVIKEMEPAIRPLPLSISPTKEVWREQEFDLLKKTARFFLQTELQQVDLLEGATYVRIKGRLWDVEQGEILWEGIGESRGDIFLFFPTAPASFERAMEVASRGLIRKLPARRS